MRKQGLFLAALLALVAAPAYAQRTSATVRGTVSDPTGAVISGAAVTLRNEATGSVRTTATSEAGNYSFAEVPIGNYSLQVDFEGFKSTTLSNIVLNVADVRSQNVQLEPGQLTEQVNVEVSSIAVQLIGGDVSGLVTGEQVRELPLNGRNFLQLATLMPGVVAPDFLNVKDKGLLGGSDLAVSGSGTTSNMWTVDGANNNDVGSNRTILIYPSVDAIEEFKIHRNSYGAEFGGASGAQINIVTRGGTNEFHGTMFYFGRNDALNSTNYFLKQAGKEKEELSRHDFGWNLGGPLVKDKLHFFASQEWNREKRGTVRTGLVPTAAERMGDFSEPRLPGCGGGFPVDPLTGSAFPGNRIPSNRLSPGGLLYLQLYSLPNTVPAAGTCNNWVESVTTPINSRQENIRFDWTLSAGTRVMMRYTQDSWENGSPSNQANLWGDDPFPAIDSNWNQPSKSVVLQLNQNIGSRAINTLQFSYSANKIEITRGGDLALSDNILRAIPPTFPLSSKQYGDGIGHPVFWGAQGYQALWNEAPFLNNQDLYVLRDDYSAVFGRHNLKIGALVSMNAKNEDTNGNGSAQNSAFWGAAGVNGWGATTGNVLSDFLLRDMTFGFSEVTGEHSNPQRWRDLEFYVSDSWKASSRLTLDFGVRYSWYMNPYADDNRISSFQPNLFDPALGNSPCNGLLIPEGTNFCAEQGFAGGQIFTNRSLFSENKSLFAPRLGLAWDVRGNGKTALRAGLGQFYLRERVSPGLNIALNPPFSQTKAGIRKLDDSEEPCEGCFGVSGGVPRAGRELDTKTPSNLQWNLTLEQEIFRNGTLELSYVGNKGYNLLRSHDANQVLPGDRNGNGVDDRLDYSRNQGLAEVRPFGVFGDAQINFWDHTAESIYHALQTQFVARFGRGSHFQTSYTWSRTIANESMDNSSGGLNNEAANLDLTRPELDRGLSRTHRAHVFNSSLVLILPSMEGKSAFARNVFGDWEVATIVAAATGIPITVYTGGVPGLPGGISGTGYVNNHRPNVVEGVSCRATGGPKEQILNPEAWTLTGFQFGTMGNSGRGICEGPGFFQVDLALYKNISLGKRVKAQLRFEVFNVLNRVNFLEGGLSNSFNPSSATFDAADVSQATRIESFQIPTTFGQATRTRDPRQAQFGIKLIF